MECSPPPLAPAFTMHPLSTLRHPRKGLSTKNHKSSAYLGGMFHKHSQRFSDWLHKLIFHLHYRATIYSTIKPANPESTFQRMPWPEAKSPGLSGFYYPLPTLRMGGLDFFFFQVHFTYCISCVLDTLHTRFRKTMCGPTHNDRRAQSLPVLVQGKHSLRRSDIHPFRMASFYLSPVVGKSTDFQ